MKEFDIYLPPRLTECNVYIYSLPYYSGIAAASGIVIDSSVDGHIFQNLITKQSGMVLYSEIEETFKLVHEQIQPNLILTTTADIETQYKLALETSGLILLSEPTKLLAEGLLRMGNSIVLESGEVPIQISYSLGHGESSLVISSYVGGTQKTSLFGSDIQPYVMLQSKVELTSRTIAQLITNGILLDVKSFYVTLEKATGGSSSIFFRSVADAILSHSLGHMESEILLSGSTVPMSKRCFATGSSGIVFAADPLETKRLNRFTVDNSIMILSNLKNLCYLSPFDVDSSIVLDSEGTVVPKKILYGVNSGVIIQSEAAGQLEKFIEVESSTMLDSEATCTLNNAIGLESSGIVIDAENSNADLKRYRLLSDVDDIDLADMDDMTLDELDWVWLT